MPLPIVAVESFAKGGAVAASSPPAQDGADPDDRIRGPTPTTAARPLRCVDGLGTDEGDGARGRAEARHPSGEGVASARRLATVAANRTQGAPELPVLVAAHIASLGNASSRSIRVRRQRRTACGLRVSAAFGSNGGGTCRSAGRHGACCAALHHHQVPDLTASRPSSGPRTARAGALRRPRHPAPTWAARPLCGRLWRRAGRGYTGPRALGRWGADLGRPKSSARQLGGRS